MKIAFLILHYNTIHDTIKCVESIQKNVNNKQYYIVIVDNKSPNDSGKILLNKYNGIKNIKVILNEKNMGFAKGNNIGFKYIKENYKVDFIAMINSDTYLLNNNFFDIIINEYNSSGFAVLGPKILLPNNQINSVQKKLITAKQLKNKMLRMKIMYYASKFYLMFVYEFLKKLFIIFRSKSAIGLSVNYSDDVNIRQENVVLHGAFLIFSKKYIEKFDGLDNRTFMYMEEKLLAARLKKEGMLSVYNPELVIFHNEDSATNSIMKTPRKKNMFVYKNAFISSKILYNELLKLEELYDEK